MAKTLRPDFIGRAFKTGDNPDVGTVPDLDTEKYSISHAQLIELIKTVLEKKSCMKLRAEGYSMNPFIKNGDILTISSVAIGGVKLGDIVAFKLPETNSLAIHRIIKIAGNSCLIRGDCCSEPDGFIPKKDILGSVSRIERIGGRVRLGIGPGKVIIAFLNGKNILWWLGRLLSKSSLS